MNESKVWWRAAMAAAWLAISPPVLAAEAAPELAAAVEAGRPTGTVVTTVDAAGLARLRDEGVAIVDVRRPDEWQSTGVIPGSTLITAFEADGQLVPGFVARVDDAVGENRPLALICRSGNRSGLAARLLMDGPGHRQLYNVAGGIGAWSAAGGPLVPCPTC
ncbi:MAG: rhodanese-like domain-containing protein [Rhodospirillales bacterium]